MPIETDPPRSNGNDSDNTLLYKIAIRLFGTGTTPTGIPTTPPTVTRHSILLDSGGVGAQLIPTGAKGYGFTVITGTASDGTASGLPVGFSQSDPNVLAAGFTVTASGGTTFVFWNS